VNWGVDKRRLLRQRHNELVGEWRTGVETLRAIEYDVTPVLNGPGTADGRPSKMVAVVGDSDPDRLDLRRMGWYLTLRPQLTSPGLAEVNRLASNRIADRGHGKLPDLLTQEIDGIERKWGLV
jgi:hypothetical protein